MSTSMVKLNEKLKEAHFTVEQGGRAWFGRRGKEIAVKRWRDDPEEPDVLCRSLESERARRRASGKSPRGLRTGCERAIAEAVAHGAPVYVVYAYRTQEKDGSTAALWPRDEPLKLVHVEHPVHVDGAWLVGNRTSAVMNATDAVQTEQLHQMLRKVRPEQRSFAKAVFEACGGRCVVTGTAAGAVLDAAHRPGRSWEAGHNNANDGWLLRVDVHRALDAGLIEISADGRLVRCDAPVSYLEEDAWKSGRRVE